MKITVILCTYNRCQSLAKTLDSVAAQELPPSVDWDVLIVDNNSRDRTRDVVEHFSRRYPDRFRYLFEPRQGKSYALNSGIRDACADVLAFMDDDVTVERAWLWNLTANLHDGGCAGAGGRTLSTWTCSRPRWFQLEGRYTLAPFAGFDLGPDNVQLFEAPYGANMAFRKAMFQKYGGFRIDLAGADGLFRNEDTEFGRRLLAAGERLRYEASAVAYHPVSPERLRRAYLLKWWFDKGRAEVRERRARSDTGLVAGIPVARLRRLASWTLRWIVAVGPPRRFLCKVSVWELAGEIVEYRQQARVQTNQEKEYV